MPTLALTQLPMRSHKDRQRELADFKKAQQRAFILKCNELYPENTIGPGMSSEILYAAATILLNFCLEGEKPRTRDTLRVLGQGRNHLERWVKREASAKIVGKLFTLWPQLSNHPLMLELDKEGWLKTERKQAMCTGSLANFGAQAFLTTTEMREKQKLQEEVRELRKAVLRGEVTKVLKEASRLPWKEIADEMLARKASVRAIAAATGVPKSTIHRYATRCPSDPS